MLYFDAAYIAKCYLNEPNAAAVRQLAYQADSPASCEIARAEFCAVVHRHLREGNIDPQEAQDVMKDFEQDESDGVWRWFPVTSSLIRLTCGHISALPATAFLRATDAIHLTCAKENGFTEVYTNDRQMLGCAQYFQVNGVNVIP